MKTLRLVTIGIMSILLIGEGVYLGSHGLVPISPSLVLFNYHIMAAKLGSTQRFYWLGIPTLQNPDDVWIVQEIIFDVKPDLIVETGTDRGGSAAIWAMIQSQVVPNGRVATIDIVDKVDRNTYPPALAGRVVFLTGSSVASDVVSKVREMAQGKAVLVILDSDHHAEHVFKELESYSQIVSAGSYVIVQDTNINHPVGASYQPGDPGPMAAVERFLAMHKEYESDVSREKFLITNHPKGYLKRIS